MAKGAGLATGWREAGGAIAVASGLQPVRVEGTLHPAGLRGFGKPIPLPGK
jgi:beta-phosphoglucomutase-like phosphatase (HAD superfamily)